MISKGTRHFASRREIAGVLCMDSVPVSSIAISGLETSSEKTLISLSGVHRAEQWLIQQPRVGRR